MTLEKELGSALALLRIALAIFLAVWVGEKFVAPAKTVAIFESFYGLRITPAVSYAIGAVQAGLLVAFVLGLAKTLSYGFFLVIHAISMAASWAPLLAPYESYNHLFHAGLPVLAALYVLFRLRHHDRVLTPSGHLNVQVRRLRHADR